MKNETPEMKNYKVRHVGGRELIVPAKNGTEAKRKACRVWGYRPGDWWVGITACSAKLLPNQDHQGRKGIY
ncbi:hypothetical protein [Paradesulfitobacterium ferrireducens]|uniref:hypothetical protein n=1 Tax=Paradesulfitobacterium ferrireducens TaxID=2816476 RepID=UPI001A8F3131|nr:hypothetical protein [Paradesulfitobacterium ferrireducens]